MKKVVHGFLGVDVVFFFLCTQDVALCPDCFKLRLPPGGAGVGFGAIIVSGAVGTVAAVVTMSDKTTKL